MNRLRQQLFKMRPRRKAGIPGVDKIQFQPLPLPSFSLDAVHTEMRFIEGSGQWRKDQRTQQQYKSHTMPARQENRRCIPVSNPPGTGQATHKRLPREP
ncbi:hypothetical protein [Thiolapillus brandeum]|uniref:hypothetical protein n=1 Tax=Thiolapillus brandeum TaxID=1076588 RepID=UPI0011856375|nr:hypothetical protein [Thiolapillus brandeum]